MIGRDEKLNAAIDIARGYKATKQQMNSLSNQILGNSQEINLINRKKVNNDKTIPTAITCTKCGRNHKIPYKVNCPEYGTTVTKRQTLQKYTTSDTQAGDICCGPYIYGFSSDIIGHRLL